MRRHLLRNTLKVLMVLSLFMVAVPAATTYAADSCGGGDQAVTTSINIGCNGKGQAVTDMAFAIIRFLGNGAGLVVIGSLVYAGLQYIGSRDDPNSVKMAIDRIRNSLFALVLYIFAFAILNYAIPQGFIFG
jgi:hypothetical protein